ncbi:MAG: beta-lactamase family protein [Acidimicrobiia bacterium]|nr:beta-lactamase family protein [Acidimicrobiia bacterium]
MPTDLQVADPSALGFDPVRLQRIDEFIRTRYLDTGLYPGFTLLISRRGEIAHLSTQGHRSVERAEPMTVDTLVRIFSMTKPITSVAMLALYEEGLYRLEDPVSMFIPSFSDLRVWEDGNPDNFTTSFPEREMIVRDLFTHTSGLTYGFMKRHPVDSMYRRRGIDGGGAKLDDWVESLAEIPLVFSPGSQWSYSVATDVLGRLVEVISGLPFDQFLSERIFQPLGMTDTSFAVGDDDADRLASLYTVPSMSPFPVPEGAEGDDKLLLDDSGPDSQYRRPPLFLSGGGGLVSTVGDYHRFTQMLLGGGALDGQRVLGRKTIEYATSNHLPGGGDLASMGQAVFSETTYEGIGFGLGFSVVLDPAAAQVITSPGVYGWGGAASTLFWIDPDEELAVVGLTQLLPSSAYPIREELRPLVYSALVD